MKFGIETTPGGTEAESLPKSGANQRWCRHQQLNRHQSRRDVSSVPVALATGLLRKHPLAAERRQSNPTSLFA